MEHTVSVVVAAAATACEVVPAHAGRGPSAGRGARGGREGWRLRARKGGRTVGNAATAGPPWLGPHNLGRGKRGAPGRSSRPSGARPVGPAGFARYWHHNDWGTSKLPPTPGPLVEPSAWGHPPRGAVNARRQRGTREEGWRAATSRAR